MTKLRFSNLPKMTQLSAWHGLTWAGRTSELWAWETVRQVGAQQGLQGSCMAAVRLPCLSHGAGDLGQSPHEPAAPVRGACLVECRLGDVVWAGERLAGWQGLHPSGSLVPPEQQRWDSMLG